jgi:hypothetical protein
MATITITADKNIDECISPMMVGVVGGAGGASTVGSSCPLNAQTGTWTARTLPSAVWNYVCAGDDRFVAVAGGPSTTAAYTLDGVTWVASTLPASKEWINVKWCGDRFVAICRGATDSAYSYNGVNWTAGGALPSAANWSKLSYDGTGTIVAVSESTAGAYSTNGGVTWSSSTLPAGDWRSVTYGEGLFVAVSYNSNDATTSADGITWDATPDDLPSTSNWRYVTYGNGYFVAIAYGSTACAYSANGTTWSAAGTPPASANWTHIMYCPSNTGLGAASVPMFYATAYNTNASSYSTDNGNTWAADTVSASANWMSYAYIGAMSGDTLTIADGATVTCNTNQKRFWKTININNGSLAVANTSTSVGLRFGMGRITTGSSQNSINVNGLGTMTVDGNFIELGTGDGSANQHVHAWTTDFIPCVWVETAASSGVFELWHNITAYSSANMQNYDYTDNSQMKYAGAGKAGQFFTQGQHSGNPETGSKFKDQWTDVLTFGDGTTGAVVPNGAKVKIPNILFSEDTQVQNFNTGYVSSILMNNSGSLTIDKALLSDFIYIDCTTAALVDWTDFAMSRRPVVTKCANFSLVRVGLCTSPTVVYYATAVRTVLISPSSTYTWSYINNGYIRDFSYSRVLPLAVTFSSSSNLGFQFQYCNNMDVSGLYLYDLNTQYGRYNLVIDFVNYSLFENLRIYGAGWYMQNCTETVVNDVDYLTSFDNKPVGTPTYPTFLYDKDGNAFADGSDYYYKFGSIQDVNGLIPYTDAGYDSHVKPFTPTLNSFPYYVGMTPGSNTVNCNWGPASILPQHNSPAFDLFRDTAIIKSENVDISIASPCVVTWTGSNLADDQPIVFTVSGGALPTGITAGTTYYVNAIDADTFNIATAPDGANINTSGSQSGIHTCTTGSRVATTNTTSTVLLTDATALNGTKYYYVLRKYKDTGNIKDDNWCDSSSMEVTPRAAKTCNNYCLQSQDFTSATWVKTNISGTGTADAKQSPVPTSTATADLLVATGNATVVQTVTGLTAGVTYTWTISLSTDDTISNFKISAVSGATTVESAATTLQAYWKQISVTITLPVGQTSVVLTLGSSTSWTNTMRVYAVNSQLDIGSTQTPYIVTTTAAITGRLYHQISRAMWNWRERSVITVYDAKTAGTSYAVIYYAIFQDTTGAFTQTMANMVYKYIGHRWNYFVNNINCDFSNIIHSDLERHFYAMGVTVYGAYVANCNTCRFLNFNFRNTGRGMRRFVYTALGSKDCLFSNWNLEEGFSYPLDATTTLGSPFYTDNSNAGITYQNFFADNYDAGFIGNWSKDTLMKGVPASLGLISDLSKPGDYQDSTGRAFTSVFDNNFYELMTSATNGMLSLRFNGSEKSTGSAITKSGSCGFDATGKLYIWDTDASITFTWPYKLRITNDFRNVTPKYNTTFWTSVVTADLVLRPLALVVEYDINTANDWTALTAANLAAEDVSQPFDFRIRITAARVVEYDGETGGGFAVGNTITGATSGATGVIEEILDRGTYGQLRISSYTLGAGVNPFVNNENLQVGGSTKGVVNQGTTYSDNTFPNAGCYIDALDIFTSVDQTIFYSPYTGGTLYLPTTITDGGDYVVKAPATINFQGTATPTLWDLSDSTFDTTTTQKVTLTNTSGAAITVAMPNGVNVINTGVGTAAITVTAPPVNTGLDFNGVVTGSTVKVFATGTQTVVATPTGPTWTWSETYSADQTVDYTIQKVGYLPIRVTGTLCSNTVQTVSVSQIADRAYTASSGLAFGSTAIVTPAAKTVRVTTATTVQNWYSFMIESWITEATLQNVAFPFTTNGPGSFTLGFDWVWADGTTSINYLYNDGMRYVDSSDVVQSIWAGVATLGTPAGMTVRYRQQPAGAISSALVTGPMSQLIQVYSNGVYDYRDHMVLKVQEPGYSQPKPDLVATYGNLEDQFYVTALTPILEYATTNSDIDAAHLALDNTAKTYTVTASHTYLELYQRAQWWSNQDAQWDADIPMTTTDGLIFSIPSTWTLTGIDNVTGAGTLSGGNLVIGNVDTYDFNRASGKITLTPTAPGTYIFDDCSFSGTITFWNTEASAVTVQVPNGTTTSTVGNPGGAITVTNPPVPPVYQSVEVTGMVANSRLQIYDLTADVELYNDVVAGTSHTWTDDVEAADTRSIRIRISNCITTTAYQFIDVVAGTCGILAGNCALSYLASQVADGVYNANGIDGSALTGYAISGTNLYIEVDDGSATWPEMYAYVTYWLYTSGGIADQDMYIIATNTANYTFYGGFKIKNTSDPTVPLLITGGNGVPSSGPATDLLDTTGGTIFVNSEIVVPYSSGAEATIAIVQSGLTAQGLTGARANNLDNLDAAVSSIAAGSGMSLAQFLALK